MKILLVGAGGRIGGLTLKRAVAANHTVYAVARTPSKVVEPASASWMVVKGDATSAADMDAAFSAARPDAVISTIGPTRGSPATLFSSHVTNLVAGCRKHGTKRLIILSSFLVRVDGTSSRSLSRRSACCSRCSG